MNGIRRAFAACLAMGALMTLAACGSDTPASVASSPSIAPSVAQSLGSAATMALCGHLDDARQALADLQASPLDPTPVIDRLDQASDQLTADASSFQQAGQTQAATIASSAANAITAVADFLRENTGAVASAQPFLGVANTLLAQVPTSVCPSASP
jgi:hypothetical protein